METPLGYTPINEETWTCFTCGQEFSAEEPMHRTEEGEPICSECQKQGEGQ